MKAVAGYPGPAGYDGIPHRQASLRCRHQALAGLRKEIAGLRLGLVPASGVGGAQLSTCWAAPKGLQKPHCCHCHTILGDLRHKPSSLGLCFPYYSALLEAEPHSFRPYLAPQFQGRVASPGRVRVPLRASAQDTSTNLARRRRGNSRCPRLPASFRGLAETKPRGVKVRRWQVADLCGASLDLRILQT